MKAVILGAGRVGSAMAIDLARGGEFEVRVADRDPARLEPLFERYEVQGERVDFSLPSTVQRAVADADYVINAVPGFLGFRTLRAVIEAGKSVVDIAFFPEDPFALDDLAKVRGVTAVVDCGVAPGMSNLLVGRAGAALDRIDRVRIYVGGLPTVRTLPYEYKAGFSPIDVVEEYTRPSRVVEAGEITIKPALSDVEFLEFPEVGTLEAFLTDGLRTLLETIPAPDMAEKTMRYPGHAERMRMLRDSGFFSAESLDVDGFPVRPIDVTTRLLFPLWQMDEADEDITVMRVIVEGERSAARLRHTYELYDRRDRVTGITSMARTTGYTATMVLRALAERRVSEAGVIPPERLGQDDGLCEFLLAGLQARGVVYRHRVESFGSEPV